MTITYRPGVGLRLRVAKGLTGTAATVTAGTTTTAAEGTSAAVSNTGTTSAAVFAFTIPRGAVPAIGFNFNTATTDADPGDGNVRFNNATPASVTQIYFDNLDRSGTTVTSWLDSFDDSTNTAKGHLVITPAATPSAKLIYNVTGSVTDGTGYRKVTVTHVAGTTLPSSSAHLAFQFASAGDQGISPATQLTFDSSTTDADPGAGEWRFNNATLSSVTAIYIDNVDASGNTITGWLDSFDDNNATASRGIIEFIDISSPATFFKGRVTGTIVDGTGYRKVTVTHLASNGTFSGLATVTFAPSGDKGADGAGTGDVVGPASATGNALARFDSTTGKLIKNSGVIVDDSNNVTGLGTVASGAITSTGEVKGDTLAINDSDDSHKIAITTGSNATANRTLTINPGDADRTLDISAANTTISSFATTVLDDTTAVAALATLTARGQGLETIFVPAIAMTARTTNGAATGTAEMPTNKNMVKTLDFDASTQEFAQFEVWFPKSWNLSTVTFQPMWSHASTSTNFGVVWALQGVARSDDDAMDVAFGTEQTSTDTGGTTNDLYLGPTSSAITIAGTPAAGDSVLFQIKRNISDGGDTMAIDARLHGIRLFFTTNAVTDA